MINNKYNTNFEEEVKQLEENISKELKEYFKNKIKDSFLIARWRSIRKKIDITKYYNFRISLLQKNVDLDFDFDIANHIVGIHTFNTLFLDEYEKGKLQKDKKYQEELEKSVISQIKLRMFGSLLFRNQKLLYVDADYLYYPPVYNLHVLTFYLMGLIIEINNTQKLKNIELEYLFMLFKILEKIKGVIALIDYNNLDSGYPIMRNIIELYVVYLSLKYSKSDMQKYKKFQEYKIILNCNKPLPEEFEKEYSKVHSYGVDRIDYLNYGWIDDIVELGYIKDKYSYKFRDLIELVNLLINKYKNVKEYGNELYSHYNKCHVFTHGNGLTFKYPILYIRDLCAGVGMVLLGIADEINKIKKIDLYEGIDIIKLTKDSLEELSKKAYTTDNFEKYYKNR